MRAFIISTVIILSNIWVHAQNSTLLITDSMFSKTEGDLKLGTMDGWVFNLGNDKNWSSESVDTKNWEKLKPIELTSKYADSNGRLEGWFRIRLKFDSSCTEAGLGMVSENWGAKTVFVNGIQIAAFGLIGSVDNEFIENSPYKKIPNPFLFEAGETYILAIHFVDHIATFPLFPPKALRSQEASGLTGFLSLTNSAYYSRQLSSQSLRKYNDGLRSATTGILALIFLLIWFFNPLEKNILRFAFGCSLLAGLSIGTSLEYISGNTYDDVQIIQFLYNFFAACFCFYLPFILAGIFNHKINRSVQFVLIGSTFILMALLFAVRLNLILMLSIAGSLFIFSFSTSIYYLVSFWKMLRGAQWAIVFGVFASFVFLILFSYALNLNLPNTLLYQFLYTISLPLGMTVYTAVRLKEMIQEVQANTQQVIQLSEEKKELAVKQQKVLEEEVSRQTAELRTSLVNLKSTQSQLIQSEKMASLGELTAGIAHEIQNPLNFVNNFSELSTELIEEMNAELNKGDIEEAKVIALDVKQNLEKINHHGKRADNIVKGMLQHSKSGSGKKEATDINALCDEYLRLAYHGLRAKDSSFNATIKTDFDASLGKLNVIPQDLGRVILNLLTNAFWAVNDKHKACQAEPVEAHYEPTVIVKTKKEGNSVLISVKDNGNGVPESIKEKIFQPFFTTKPTGQGTGLGLSLSYDIVKAHGGELRVETKENEGSTFIIQLPISNA